MVKLRAQRWRYDEQTGELLAYVSVPAPSTSWVFEGLKDRVLSFETDDPLPFPYWKVVSVTTNSADGFFGARETLNLIFQCTPFELPEEDLDDPFLDKLDRMIQLLEEIRDRLT